MNRVDISGRIATGLNLKEKGKTKWMQFVVVVNRYREGKEYADFIQCIAFGVIAERIKEFLHKGSQITIAGTLKSSKWKTRSGEVRYGMQVLVEEAIYLDDREVRKQEQEIIDQNEAVQEFMKFRDDLDLELPFG